MRQDNLKKVISTPLDQRIVEQLPKGGRTLSYVSGSSMYVLLEQAFGPYFSIEYSEPHYVKYDKARDSDPEPAKVVEVKCTLTVPLYDPETKQTIMVKREGFGTATMKSHFEEMILKTAQTDALKKATYSFGIALELSSQKTDNERAWFGEQVFGAWTPKMQQFFYNELAEVNKMMQAFQVNDPNVFAQNVLRDPSATLNSHNIREVIAKAHQLMEKQKGEKAA